MKDAILIIGKPHVLGSRMEGVDERTATEKLEQLVAKKMLGDESVSYSAALLSVQKENLSLAREAAEELDALRGK